MKNSPVIEQKTVEYTDRAGNTYALTVGYCNALIDTRRALYTYRADVDNKTEPDEAKAIIRRFTYPDLVAPVIAQTGFDHWPITVDELCGMEPGMIKAWADAVYEVNPSWSLAAETEEENQKKA